MGYTKSPGVFEKEELQQAVADYIEMGAEQGQKEGKPAENGTTSYRASMQFPRSPEASLAFVLAGVQLCCNVMPVAPPPPMRSKSLFQGLLSQAVPMKRNPSLISQWREEAAGQSGEGATKRTVRVDSKVEFIEPTGQRSVETVLDHPRMSAVQLLASDDALSP